jgi:uncharacterized protein YceH (UPF0502 family)
MEAREQWQNKPMPSTDPIPTVPIVLTAAQARVLGALVEKEVTTPEYYPLSLNALINASNQRSNREPVMNLDEEAVRMAVHRLDDLHLAGRARSADGRVTKYEHWLGEAFNFSRAETALICVLLLRGPQTPGELRGRTERMHSFDELTDVLAGLQKLMEREPPLVAVLPRQPGTKEARYTHLLSGPVEAIAAVFAAEPAFPRREGGPDSGQNEGHENRIAQLEATVAELRQEVAVLHQKIDDLFGDG